MNKRMCFSVFFMVTLFFCNPLWAEESWDPNIIGYFSPKANTKSLVILDAGYVKEMGESESLLELLSVYQVDLEEYRSYRKENEAEQRLITYKDGEEGLCIKLAMLKVINASRAKYGVAPVKLDILASRVANKHCEETSKNKFLSHWNMAGEKPYQRYAIAGGTDHVTENAACIAGSIGGTLSIDHMKKSHYSFMAEIAPYDGHKINVIDKFHTHVGLGFYHSETYFTYYEEYIDRYLEITTDNETFNSGKSLKVGDKITFKFRPLDTNLRVYFIVCYVENLPAPMTVAQLNSTSSYPDYTNSTFFSWWNWEKSKMVSLAEDGSALFTFEASKKGSYYVQVYLDKKTSIASRSGGTQGKGQGSGLVLRVE